jgi:predicted transcriptional regulator
MTALTLRLPDSVHRKVKELAREDGVSVNQFLASAAAEKISSILTVNYLEEEAKKASQLDFERVLSKTPSVPPDEEDVL